MVFLVQADFEVWNNTWADIYYLWQAAQNLFFVLCFFSLKKSDIEAIRSPKYKYLIKPFVIYLSIRLLWAIIKPFTTLDENHPVMVTLMFTVLLTGVIISLLADLKRRFQEG